MLESKLNINNMTIDNKNTQVWYCFNCLKEKAAVCLNSWMQNYKNMSLFIVKEFIEQTCKIFSDSEKIWNVLWKLDYMWQENCLLNEFLSEFDQTLLKAQAHVWESDQKKNYFHAAINCDLQKKMITVNNKNDYNEYC